MTVKCMRTLHLPQESVCSVQNNTTEMKAIEGGRCISTLNKKRKKLATKTQLDDFNIDILRRWIIIFYATGNKVPTLEKIITKKKNGILLGQDKNKSKASQVNIKYPVEVTKILRRYFGEFNRT